MSQQEYETVENDNLLDSFEHVVVLMFENRSFDNLLGYMYPNGVPDDAPAGKQFNGVTGKQLSNPVPDDVKHRPPSGVMSIPVSPTQNPHHPFPDPGEEYSHINTQLFNVIDGNNNPPYNLPDPVPAEAGMQGFVKDYIENYKTNQRPGVDPTYEEYSTIMGCFETSAVPVLTTLAEQFAVFDHWFCSVPSQTWCNRAFWNAGTSWGHVVNGDFSKGNIENSLSWVADNGGATIFNQISETGPDSELDWKIYSSNEASLTGIIHGRALLDYHLPEGKYFPTLEQFFTDCEQGVLPAYSFIEPNFWTPHNDMHPSTFGSKHYGPDKAGSVLLGEHLLWQVYNAVKSSASTTGSNWENTLLIVTCDEHGGCYDHVSPPKATPPDLSDYTKWQGFDFERLGIRVPTIMISAHIEKNTVINTPMSHDSFLKTMQKKWSQTYPGKFPPLSTRQQSSTEFTSVFTATAARPTADWPTIPEPTLPVDETDYSDDPITSLQRSILTAAFHAVDDKAGKEKAVTATTQREAVDLARSLSKAPGKNRSHLS